MTPTPDQAVAVGFGRRLPGLALPASPSAVFSPVGEFLALYRAEGGDAVPVAVLARPGEQLRAGLSPAARRFARWRLPQAQAAALPFCRPPAWTLLSGPMLDLSSTALRAAGAWER